MNTHPYNGHLSGTAWVGRYQNKHSPTHTHPVHQTSFINFLHLLRSIASSLLIYVLDGLFSTIFFPQHIQVLFGLPLCLLVWNPLLHTPYISSRSFLQRMPIPSQPLLQQCQCYVVYSQLICVIALFHNGNCWLCVSRPIFLLHSICFSYICVVFYCIAQLSTVTEYISVLSWRGVTAKSVLEVPLNTSRVWVAR